MAPIRRQRFRSFMSSLDWRQGEHVLLAAPTQTGKTTLASMLAPRRSDVVVLASKVQDDNLRNRYRSFRRYDKWPPLRSDHRILLWPKRQQTLSGNVDTQRVIFKSCLDDVGRAGGWCVIVDEAHWCSQFLRLDREIAVLHHQGSSSGITMMVLTQRPAWIPRIVYSSATHVFLGKTSARDDLKSISSMGGGLSKQVAETLDGMGRHDLLYLNPMGDHDPVIINTAQ